MEHSLVKRRCTAPQGGDARQASPLPLTAFDEWSHLSMLCFLTVESLYMALKNIDRADIVASLEAPQPPPGSLEEGACRPSDRDSTLLSPSVINGKTTKHIR